MQLRYPFGWSSVLYIEKSSHGMVAFVLLDAVYASVAMHSVMCLLNKSSRLLFRSQRPTIMSFKVEHKEVGGGFFILP